MKYLPGLLFLYCMPALALDLGSATTGIWSLPPAGSLNRWVVLHQVDEPADAADAVCHIEVIGRVKGNPPWQIRHLAAHMAITRSALEQSVVAPLGSGDVYPETYLQALAQWKAENAGKGGVVCTTSVLECMQESDSSR